MAFSHLRPALWARILSFSGWDALPALLHSCRSLAEELGDDEFMRAAIAERFRGLDDGEAPPEGAELSPALLSKWPNKDALGGWRGLYKVLAAYLPLEGWWLVCDAHPWGLLMLTRFHDGRFIGEVVRVKLSSAGEYEDRSETVFEVEFPRDGEARCVVLGVAGAFGKPLPGQQVGLRYPDLRHWHVDGCRFTHRFSGRLQCRLGVRNASALPSLPTMNQRHAWAPIGPHVPADAAVMLADLLRRKPRASGGGGEEEDEPPAAQPKRYLSAFMYFYTDIRPSIVADNPGMVDEDVGKTIHAMWRELDVADRAPYQAQADADKKRYEREIESGLPYLTLEHLDGANGRRLLLASGGRTQGSTIRVTRQQPLIHPGLYVGSYHRELYEQFSDEILQLRYYELVPDDGALDVVVSAQTGASPPSAWATMLRAATAGSAEALIDCFGERQPPHRALALLEAQWRAGLACRFVSARKVTGDVHVPSGEVTWVGLVSVVANAGALGTLVDGSGQRHQPHQAWPGWGTLSMAGFQNPHWAQGWLLELQPAAVDARQARAEPHRRSRYAFHWQGHPQPLIVLAPLPNRGADAYRWAKLTGITADGGNSDDL
jgi:hypothetical protein